MPKYTVSPDLSAAHRVPFGLGHVKPKHFREMAKVVWQNRDNLNYAWKVLSRGACDGCALGAAGLHDWTTAGMHLCQMRLDLLRLNTMPALDIGRLGDVAGLRTLSNQQLRRLGRLPCPAVRERDATGFRRISWEEAYGRIARRLRGCDPRKVAFFLGAHGITNEVYYMAQKVARFLGTNHIDNAAGLGESPAHGAMSASLGVAASTCSYKDWYGTDLIIFFGSNPANDQPVAMKYLQEAKRLGTRVLLVNPLLEPGMKNYWVPSSVRSALFGTELADYWFPVAQRGDVAFLNGVMKQLIVNRWVDERFISEHTTGFDALRIASMNTRWDVLEKEAGLPRAAMQEFADLVHKAKTGVLAWSMGITQHSSGSDGVQAILNLALSQGWLGRDHCGVVPLGGHSSVQGGAEMGACAGALPGAKPLTQENVEALSWKYGFKVPEWPGMTTPEMVEAAACGELDIFYGLGGNLLAALPEPDYVARALGKIPLRVHQDVMLTSQMFLDPKEEVLLLPARTRYEQDDGGTATSTERRVIFSPEIPRQVGEARADWKILRELAAIVHPERAHLLDCETGWTLREEIARVVPFYGGIQHLKQTGDAFQYGGRHLCVDGVCPTPDGRARFRAVPLVRRRTSSEFQVSTRRGKQLNTMIFSGNDPLTGAARDAVFMSTEDAESLHMKHGDRVTLVNKIGRYEGHVFLAPIAPGNLQIHWPEGNVIIRRRAGDAYGSGPDDPAEVRVERI